MRRINIKIQDQLMTRSFEDKDQFELFVANDLGSRDYNGVANTVWDLNVGGSYTYFNHRFSINSKRRAGNKMINNTRIGDQI